MAGTPALNAKKNSKTTGKKSGGKHPVGKDKTRSFAEETTLQQFMEFAPVAFIAIDEKSKVFLANQLAGKLLGYTLKQLTGKTLNTFLPKRFHKIHDRQKSNYLKKPEKRVMGIGLEVFCLHKSGKEIPVEVGLNPVTIAGKTCVLISLVDISIRKEIANSISENQQKYASLFENSLDAVLIVDDDQRYVDANPAACNMLGYTKKDLIGRKISDIVATDEAIKQHLWGDFIKNKSQASSIFLRRKDGSIILTEYTAVSNFMPGLHVSFSRDVTPQRKVEMEFNQHQARTNAILTSVKDGIISLDNDQNIIFFNKGAEEMFQCAAADAIGGKLDRFIPEKLRGKHSSHIKSFGKTSGPERGMRAGQRNELTAMRADGSSFPIEASISVVSIGGKKFYTAVVRDISARKESEEALRKSESKLRTLFDTMTEGVALNECIYNKKGEMVDYRILEINSAFYKTADYAGKKVVGSTATELYGMTPDFIKEFWKAHKHKTQPVQTEMVSPLSGRHFYVSTSPFIGNQFATFFFDITEQKKNEENLQKSEARFRALFENSPLSIWEEDFSGVKSYLEELKAGGIKDLNAYFDENPQEVARCAEKVIILDVNQAAVEMEDAPNKESLLKNLREIVNPKAIHNFKLELKHILAGDLHYKIEMEYFTLTGRQMFLDVHWSVMPGHEHDLSRVILSIVDVTAQKYAEQAVRDSEEKLNAMLQSTVEGMVMVNMQGEILFANPSAERILELTRSKIESRTYDSPEWQQLDEFDNPFPQDQLPLAIVLREQRPVENIEHQIKSPRGEKKWLSVNAAPLLNDQGEMYGAIAAFSDITERKNAEVILRESRQRFEMALAAGNQGSWMVDWPKQINIVDERWAAMLGYALEEVGTGLDFWESHVHPDDLKYLYQEFERHVRGEIPMLEVELRAKTKTGEWRWIADRARIVKRTSSGEPLVMYGTHTDVTERKQAEEALRQSEERLQMVNLATQDGIYDWDIKRDTIYRNQNYQAIFGLNVPITTDKFWWEKHLHLEDRETVLAGQQKAFEEKLNTLRREYRLQRHDGTFVIVHDRAYITYDETGAPIRMIGAISDVTRQKNAEEALRRSEERLQMVNLATQDAIYDWDIQKGSVYRNLKYQSMFAPDEPTTTDKFWWDEHLHPSDREAAITSLKETLKNKLKTWAREYRLQRHDGTYAIVYDRAYITYTEAGVPSRMIGAISDITERKTLEENLRLNLRAIQSATEGIIISAHQGTPDNPVIFVNEGFVKLTGYAADEVIGTDCRFLQGKDTDKAVVGRISQSIKNQQYFEGELINYKKDGTPFWNFLRLSPVFDEKGNCTHFVGLQTDITEKKQTEMAIQRQNEYLELLNKTTTAIIEAGDFESMMEKLVFNVKQLMRCDDCYITQWDEHTQDVVPIVSTARLSKPYHDFVYPRDKKNLTKSALEYGTTLIVDDIHASAYTSPEASSQFDLKSAMAIPLIYSNHKLGAIIISFDDTHMFTEEEKKNGQQIGNEIALAIWNAQQEYELQRKLKEANALERITTALSESERIGLKDVLDLIARSALDMIPNAAQAVIHLINTEGTALIPEAIAGFEGKGGKSSNTNMNVGEGIAGKVIAEGGSMYLPDVEEHPEYLPADSMLTYKSLLVTPISSRNSKLGTISIQSPRINAFNRNEINLLAALGAQAAIAIENAWLYDKLQAELEENKKAKAALDIVLKAEREQRLLAETSAEATLALSSRIELKGVLDEILVQVQRLLPGCAANIALVSEENRLQVSSWRGYENRGEELFSTSLSHDIEEFKVELEAFRKRAPEYVRNSLNYEGWHIFKETEWIRSHLAIPLFWQEEPIGILRIDEKKPEAFSEQDIAHLAPLVNAATVALYSANLFKNMQDALRETNALYRVTAGLANLNSDELLQDVVSLLVENFKYSYVQILLVEEGSGDLVLHTGSGETGRQLKASYPVFKAGMGIIGIVAKTGVPFYTNNVDEIEQYVPNPFLNDVKAKMACPIKMDDRTIGILDIQLTEGRRFTKRDLQVATAITEQLSIALQKARLYESLQISLEQEKAIRNQLVQNERLAIMGKLLASVSHELNNPLQAIQNALFLLKEESGISEQGKQDLEIVLSESERMAALIDQLRATYRPTLSEDFAPVDVNTVLEDVYMLISTHLRHNRISFEFHPEPALPAISAIRDQIRQVILNLMINAVEAMPDGGTLNASTIHVKDVGEIQIIISDTGSGIAPDILHHIFDAFVTNKPRGTGLGLTITYDIVTKHHGRIQAENNPEQGATFTVWLPLENRETL